jgi:hypothetical protein
MNAIQYILISTICLSISYLAYLLMYRKEDNFRQMRLTLLASVVFSVMLPFSTFTIETSFPLNQDNIEKEVSAISTLKQQNTVSSGSKPVAGGMVSQQASRHSETNWPDILKKFYFIVFLILFLRIPAQIGFLLVQVYKSPRIKDGRYTIVYSSSFKNPFSFFNWIFINPEECSKEEKVQIIFHEKIHASQYHSIDLIMIETLAAAMWFNPLVWMMRNSIKLVHEYLADEGALKTGINKLSYQAHLINLTTEERLFRLSSGFNYSLIKKRMLMMNKSNFHSGTKIKIFALVPLAAILCLAVACIKGGDKAGNVTAVESVKMNVLYIGVDNPIAVASSESGVSELTVSIDNGTISGTDGMYVANPKEPGLATITVNSNGKEIRKAVFRAKFVPDPEGTINTGAENRTDGFISKEELLKAGGIVINLRNFDFDLSFKVVSFVLSATMPNSNVIREEISNSDKFSQTQIELIKVLVKNQKLAIEEIKVIGPDDKLRKLKPMVFNISGE